jgi:putative Ca2+/H+ antiporter (TMEM165/GDT1 family)
MDWLIVALAAFALIAPVELPDKTFVATLVLSTRYPALPVWLGVVAAFGVQCAVAVGAGHLLSRLPDRPVALVAAGLFAVGAVVMAVGARRTQTREAVQEREFAERVDERSPPPGGGPATPATGWRRWRAAGASFLVLFTAEWGDLSQLLTAGLVASGRPALPVFVGAWAALAAVSGAAVLLGRWLQKRLPLAPVRYVAAFVCAALAVITAASVL